MTEYILLRTSGPAVVPTADLVTHAINVVDYPHHEIHSGSAYLVVYSALADDTDVIEVRIETPNTAKWAHMVITIDAALAATATLWHPTTKTHVGGNALTAMNRNHNSTNSSGLTICHTPAGSQAGAGNLVQYLGAATTSGRADTGGATGSRGEFILKQNDDYLINMTSRADSNAMTITLDWYEHTSKG
jgi:hypothetical protein